MKRNKSKKKTLVLSLALAALLLPANLNAQINRGLLQNPYKSHDDHLNRGAMGRGSTGGGITNQTYGSDADGFGITNQTYGQNE